MSDDNKTLIDIYALYEKAIRAKITQMNYNYDDEGGLFAEMLSDRCQADFNRCEQELISKCFPEEYYEIKGDLLDTFASIVVHGCNCQGVMGSGVAKAIKLKYPKVYEKYRTVYEKKGLELGQIIKVPTNDFTIMSAMTQKYYGRDGKLYADYEAIRTSLTKINEYCKKYSHHNFVALPKIGCGLAGGDWNIVKDIVKSTLTDVIVLVYYLE